MIFQGCWPVCGCVVLVCAHVGFFPGGLYRIDCWRVVFSSGCVFEWCCTSMSIVRWEGEGAPGCPYLPESLRFLLPGMAPVTLALMDLQGMCWPYASYSSRIFVCKMQVWYLFSLSTSPEMDHEGVERRVFSTPVLVQRWRVDSLPFFCFTGTLYWKTISQLHLCFAHSI